MNKIDNDFQDLNEIIIEIEKLKIKLSQSKNNFTKYEEMLKLDISLITCAFFASSISCFVLKTNNLITLDKAIESQVMLVGSVAVCAFASNLYGVIKNKSIQEDIDSKEKCLDYLNKLYDEKVNAIQNNLDSDTKMKKRELKKDN